MGARILLVEDEDAIADAVVRGLAEEGYAVERTATVAASRAALAAGGWDAILLDRWLPDGDGLDLLAGLRAADPLTPVLVLTARDAVPDRVEGLDAGADDYLGKPVSFDELLARLRAVGRRTDGAVFRHAGVRVDLAGPRADRAGRRLDLTTKEFALLLYLVRHPDRPLPRPRLYEAVWGERYDGLSNTLEVHVAALRRKLEAHGPRLIHTLHGVGYQFAAAPP